VTGGGVSLWFDDRGDTAEVVAGVVRVDGLVLVRDRGVITKLVPLVGQITVAVVAVLDIVGATGRLGHLLHHVVRGPVDRGSLVRGVDDRGDTTARARAGATAGREHIRPGA